MKKIAIWEARKTILNKNNDPNRLFPAKVVNMLPIIINNGL